MFVKRFSFHFTILADKIAAENTIRASSISHSAWYISFRHSFFPFFTLLNGDSSDAQRLPFQYQWFKREVRILADKHSFSMHASQCDAPLKCLVYQYQ